MGPSPYTVLPCPSQSSESDVPAPSDGYVAGYTPHPPLTNQDSDNFVHQMELEVAAGSAQWRTTSNSTSLPQQSTRARHAPWWQCFSVVYPPPPSRAVHGIVSD